MVVPYESTDCREKKEMVKVVVGEESQVKLAEDRLSKSGVPCQVNNKFMYG